MPSPLIDEPMMTALPVWLRPARAADAAALLQLAELLDTMNLPQDPETIASIIAESEASFARLAHPVPASTEATSPRGTYTLVAVQGERLLGTASLLSHHGTPPDPHYYLRVVEQAFHSKQLNTERRLHLLRLERDEVPWTELGGLVVHPEARGQGLGKLLVAARLLLVAMHGAHFCQRLLAELLPPQREDGSNAFWDALGGPLTGLNYYRADLLCRTDKEFIEALFPRHEIVLELLPPEAQAVVGQVGPATVPVCHLLRRAGFRYLGTVDPFDGGPHYGATRQDIQPIQRSRALVCLDFPPTETGRPVLLGNPLSHHFYAAPAEVHGHGCRLDKVTAELLDLHPGDLTWVMPLDW
jgi:arginine N-succinyltransferase